jgi:hypothetical protein
VIDRLTARSSRVLTRCCLRRRGDGWGVCPSSADETAQPPPLVVLAEHHLRVHTKRQLRVAVPELLHDVRNLVAGSQPQRRERPAQGVRRDAIRDSRPAGVHELLVRQRHSPLQDAPPNVVAVLRATGSRREDEVAQRRVDVARAIADQLVAQDRQEVDIADSGLRLRVADPQPASGEIHVAPPQLQELTDAEPAERERRDQRAAVARITGSRPVVKLTSGIEERFDLLRTIQPRPPRLRRLESPSTPLRRVALEPSVLDRELKDLRQTSDRLVDRRGAQAPLRDLQMPVAIHLFNRDLRKTQASEVGQQVVAELPLVVEDRVRRPFAAPRCEPPEANSWKVGSDRGSGATTDGSGSLQMPRRTSARTF